MPLQFTCPFCKAAQTIPDAARGQAIACPNCKKTVKIAAPAAPPLAKSVQSAPPLARPVAPVTRPAVRQKRSSLAIYLLGGLVIATMATGVTLAIVYWPGRTPAPNSKLIAKVEPAKSFKETNKPLADNNVKKPEEPPEPPDPPDEGADDLFEGCVVNRTMGEPYLDGEQTKVRFDFTFQDPRKLIKDMKIVVWTGDVGAPKPASSRQPRARAGDSPRVEVPVVLKGNRGTVHVVLPALPKDKMYWLQPMLVNADGKSQWLAVEPWEPTAPPLERRSAFLAHKMVASERKAQLSSQSTVTVIDQGKPFLVKIDLQADLDETVSTDGAGASLRLKFPRVQFDFTVDNVPNIVSRQLEKPLAALQKVTSTWRLDPAGTLTKLTVNLDTVPDAVRKEVAEFHDRLAQAVELVNLKVPNRELQALETWTDRRPWKKATLELTATYEGRRMHQQREEAFLSLRGTLKGTETAKSGKIEGTALVDLQNGFVMKADLKVETDITLPFVNRPDLHAQGMLEVRLTREWVK